MPEEHNEQAATSDVIAQMRKQYDSDPSSVPSDWQEYFKAVDA